MKLPTVTILREGREVRINASDYDADVHTLAHDDAGDDQGGEQDAETFASETSPRAPEATLGQHKGAGWYYVEVEGTRQTDKDGEPILVGRGKEKAREQIEEMNG